MSITVDIASAVPVFEQLVQQIRDAVLAGELHPGTALPTIRQLANDLQLNPNTVARAYKVLERDGVIETRGRSGSFIHMRAKRHSKNDARVTAVAALTESIEALRAAGLTDSEIRVAFAAAMKSE
jgi:GntR family transcriptional regulator